MANADDLKRIARALDGTTEHAHFDRLAFKVKRIFVTLAADGRSANVKLLPDEQAFKVMMNPGAFSIIDNAWGAQGWTQMALDQLEIDELSETLELAWTHGRATRARR